LLQKLCQVELRFALKFIECQDPGFGKEYPLSSLFKKSLQLFAAYFPLCEQKLGEVPLFLCQKGGWLAFTNATGERSPIVSSPLCLLLEIARRVSRTVGFFRELSICEIVSKRAASNDSLLNGFSR